jgi:hypothetical protein
MRDILRRLVPPLRAAGFRGSGQTYRKVAGDFVFVVNFQGNRWGDLFYVNLGAQPVFIPAEGHADLEKLKEYECILRSRVGKAWPRQMSHEQMTSLQAELLQAQNEFFGQAQTMRTSFVVDSTEVLLGKFGKSNVCTEARSALHLARAALALGHPGKARELTHRGFELAGEDATILRAELKEVADRCRD